MNTRNLAAYVAAFATSVSALIVGAPIAAADDAGCSDVTLIFARGTDEPAGLGRTGQEFANQLAPRMDGRTLAIKPVDYTANMDFWNSTIEGINNTASLIHSVASTCPDTQIVLGGFSQGAAVVGYTTSENVPVGIDPADVPAPIDAATAGRVSSVVLFGTPTPNNLGIISAPPIVVGPAFAEKTVEICNTDDPVCADGGREWAAHNGYIDDGLVAQGADFAAAHLSPKASDLKTSAKKR